MNRKDMICKLIMSLARLDMDNPNGYDYHDQAEHLLDEIDKHMDPKTAGSHQSSYDVAMGSQCEWSRNDIE